MAISFLSWGLLLNTSFFFSLALMVPEIMTDNTFSPQNQALHFPVTTYKKKTLLLAHPEAVCKSKSHKSTQTLQMCRIKSISLVNLL